MELSMTDKANSLVYGGDAGHLFHHFDHQAGLLAGVQFLLKVGDRIAWVWKKVAVDPLEMAVDLMRINRPFDPFKSSPMTLGRHARFLFSKAVGEVIVPVVKSRRNVCCSAAGFAR